ncbi:MULTISPECIES: hypothetical protein [Candidatus Ichthyocystis]|uniref:hypothetical protein n=2 Tax=Burkholderiales genera incertae sedis TaxID=224471 RepID=UPI000B86F4B5|nr:MULTISPECIES: hypothetical protein [Ichthyocystis]
MRGVFSSLSYYVGLVFPTTMSPVKSSEFVLKSVSQLGSECVPAGGFVESKSSSPTSFSASRYVASSILQSCSVPMLLYCLTNLVEGAIGSSVSGSGAEVIATSQSFCALNFLISAFRYSCGVSLADICKFLPRLDSQGGNACGSDVPKDTNDVMSKIVEQVYSSSNVTDGHVSSEQSDMEHWWMFINCLSKIAGIGDIGNEEEDDYDEGVDACGDSGLMSSVLARHARAAVCLNTAVATAKEFAYSAPKTDSTSYSAVARSLCMSLYANFVPKAKGCFEALEVPAVTEIIATAVATATTLPTIDLLNVTFPTNSTGLNITDSMLNVTAPTLPVGTTVGDADVHDERHLPIVLCIMSAVVTVFSGVAFYCLRRSYTKKKLYYRSMQVMNTLLQETALTSLSNGESGNEDVDDVSEYLEVSVDEGSDGEEIFSSEVLGRGGISSLDVTDGSFSSSVLAMSTPRRKRALLKLVAGVPHLVTSTPVAGCSSNQTHSGDFGEEIEMSVFFASNGGVAPDGDYVVADN